MEEWKDGRMERWKGGKPKSKPQRGVILIAKKNNHRFKGAAHRNIFYHNNPGVFQQPPIRLVVSLHLSAYSKVHLPEVDSPNFSNSSGQEFHTELHKHALHR